MLDDSPKIIYEPSQIEAIGELVDKRIADGTLHPDMADDRIGDFALSIRSEEIVTRAASILTSSRIKSKELSDIIDRLYIDILTLFKSIDRAENAVNFKKRKSDQQFKASFDSYLKIKSDVSSFIDGYKNQNYDEIRRISFFEKRNQSFLDLGSVVDWRSNKLVLDGDHTNIASETTLTASVDYHGEAYNSEMPLSNIVDPDPNTYWQSVVMLDAEAPSVLATVKISMTSVQELSSIFILPFSPQPILISDARYSLDGVSWIQIPDFNPSLATQNTDYVSLYFPMISARFIEIDLVQENPIYRERLIPVSYEMVTKDIYKDRLAHSISLVDFSDYDSRADTIREDMISAIINAATLDAAPLNIVSGYEYVFGLSDISIFKSSYKLNGKFSSQSFSNYKNAFSIELRSTEFLSEATSIEYDVDIGGDRRLPIVPVENNNLVFNEVLSFNGRSFISPVRFTIDIEKSVSVFENGIKISPRNYSFTNDSIILLSIEDDFIPSNSNIYTASYSSVGGSQINLHDQLNSIPSDEEAFIGSSPVGEISLKSYPHIEYGVVNDLKNFYYTNGVYVYSGDINTVLGFNSDEPTIPIQIGADSLNAVSNVFYLDGIAYGNTPDTTKRYSPIQVFVDDIPAINITNYLGGDQKALSNKPFGDTVYEYIQKDNRIIFGTRIIGKDIRVQYNSMARHIQLVMTLRRTSSLDDSVTPVLKDATLYIKARNK